MASRLNGATVVVTGASSGIGRATALRFAAEGAHVVLAARRGWALEEAAAECAARGGRALAVPTDVADEGAVRALAQQAVETFGRIDVWVNNAGVYLLGPFEGTPSEVFHRVLEVNLNGCLHGAWAALPIFRAQGEGVLINVGSVDSKIPMPYAGAYIISKRGVAALGEVLRQELALQGLGDAIHVCTVMPATIDTPLFQHAANFTGRGIKALPPVYPAEEVAAKIVELAEHPEREVTVGTAGRLAEIQHAVAPGLFERTAATAVDKEHLTDEPAAPTPGNLFQPVDTSASISGGWRADGNGGSLGKRLAAGVLVGLPALWAFRRYKETARG